MWSFPPIKICIDYSSLMQIGINKKHTINSNFSIIRYYYRKVLAAIQRHGAKRLCFEGPDMHRLLLNFPDAKKRIIVNSSHMATHFV